MYRHIAAVLMVSFALVIAMASAGNAAMVFSADMNQDGIADANWPLPVGATVTVEIFVSNIPEPGLGAMGFVLTYDGTVLDVTAADLDTVNWPSLGVEWTVRYPDSGETEFQGYRIPEVTGLSGDNIRLATVTFQRIAPGEAQLRLEDPNTAPENGSFVLLDDTVLDGDIGLGGLLLATIQPPIAGDVNGDGIVDLADAILTLQTVTATGSGVAHRTGDSTGDDTIGLEEGIWVLQKAAGLR